MIQCHSLTGPDLDHFLARHRAAFALGSDIELDVVLKQILHKAYEFVPSESGSILLDDPFLKMMAREENDLVFIAVFGEGSETLLGHRIPARQGIAGRVYETGLPYLSRDVDTDRFFLPKIDHELGFKTHSVVCVPVYIGKNVCGVLELINRSSGRFFTTKDMSLLEIFAGYTSFMLQKALDAKRAHELAKRDDLTGLFNDRWFHVRLAETLVEASETGDECSLIFLDLDNFKSINDTHGHLAGSQVLREVGFLLSSGVTDTRAVVSRYGGDEFVIILPGVGSDQARQIAEQIRKRIEESAYLGRPYGFGMPALHIRNVISASLGVATYNPRHDTASTADIGRNEFLRQADSAMYQAKLAGKNQVVVAGNGDGQNLLPASSSGATRSS